jgi:hypothetical protein
MVFIDVIFSGFLVGGIALIRWSRRIGDANLAANRAAADSLGISWMQRLLAKPWMRVVSRSSAVMVGVVWIGIAILALVAVNM